MADVFLYSGNSNPNDVTLRDPTTTSGALAITGTGNITFAVAAFAATAEETFAGGGAGITFAGPAFAAAGVETFTGIGTIAFGGPVLDAVGIETFTATGAATVSGPSFAATGFETFAGSSDVVFSALHAATGAETFTADGAIAFGVPGLVGGVVPAIDGNGDVTWRAPQLDAIGTGPDQLYGVGGKRRLRHAPARWMPPRILVRGAGAVAIDPPQLAGDGAITITGSGRVTVAASLAAIGVQEIRGTGTCVVGRFGVAAVVVVNPFARAQAEDLWITEQDEAA